MSEEEHDRFKKLACQIYLFYKKKGEDYKKFGFVDAILKSCSSNPMTFLKFSNN